VKIYADTNVLMAACVEEHPHHLQAFELLAKVKSSALQGFISSHTLAEFYSVLTRAPFIPRVHPAEAGRLLEDNILPHFELVTLSPEDYKSVLAGCAKAGLIGGVVYDALHLHCAQKAGCKRIYTFNVRDFRALAPTELQDKIAAP
jgi:predicted nucleic acid-binding protein